MIVKELDRPEFITELFGEIERVDENMYPISCEVDTDETVVGVAAPFLRKTYALCQHYQREADQNQLELKYAGESTNRAQLHRSEHQARDRAHFLEHLFWTMVTEGLDIDECNVNLGLRKEWKLVTQKRDDSGEQLSPDHPLSALSNLLNGGLIFASKKRRR